MKVAAIVPCFNEANCISQVVNDLQGRVDKIVVVDDGSGDESYNLAGAAGATVLRHAINRDYGATIVTGFTWALGWGADILVMFDGDGQFSAAEITNLIQPIKEGRADAVIGSKFLNKQFTQRIPTTKKNFILLPARWLEYWLTGLKLSDVHNGFRALSSQAVRRMSFNQDGMAFQTELDRQIKKLNLRVVEVPVTVRYYRYGQGLWGGLRILRDVLWAKLAR